MTSIYLGDYGEQGAEQREGVPVNGDQGGNSDGLQDGSGAMGPRDTCQRIHDRRVSRKVYQYYYYEPYCNYSKIRCTYLIVA